MEIELPFKIYQNFAPSNSKIFKRQKRETKFHEIESFALQNKSCENFL